MLVIREATMADKTTLGEFEHHVLLAAMRLGSGAYTASIVTELEACTEREVAAAAVYIALRRLEEHGLVESAMLDRREKGERRRRRYFTVTEEGLALAWEARRRLTRLWADLDLLESEG
jgi:DNA-binding PadR family transcriptional regulator